MNSSPSHRSRRSVLRLGLGALCAAGLWPGQRPLRGAALPARFRFLVVNDTHCASAECGPWLRRLVAQMRTHPDVAFCLHLGDATDQGERAHLETVREVFSLLGVPFHVVPGNHDWWRPDDRGPYDSVFSQKLNYVFQHEGWHFLGLDTTDGQRWQHTHIQPETLAWLDAALPQLDRAAPLVLFTHFPLAHVTPMVPTNADAVLERLLPFNLRAAFSGHYHGFTESWHRSASLTTNRCCSRLRDNHDGTRDKGYWLCSVDAGRLSREFISFNPEGGSPRT